MIAKNTASTCPAWDCTESPLSIKSDVIGILTFAIAAWMFIVYCYHSFRSCKICMACNIGFS